jgi:hypothetical protein
MAAVDSESTPASGDEPRARRSGIQRLRNALFAALALIVVVVAVVFGPTVLHVVQQRNTKVATPAQIAGLEQDKTEGAATTAEYLRDAVATAVDLDNSVAVVYEQGSDNTKSVLFVGGTAHIWRPGDALDDAFKFVADDTGGLNGVRSVPAGELGGVMRCGTTKTDDGEMPVCGWADNGSLAVALFPGRGLDEAAKLLQQMRAGMQTR